MIVHNLNLRFLDTVHLLNLVYLISHVIVDLRDLGLLNQDDIQEDTKGLQLLDPDLIRTPDETGYFWLSGFSQLSARNWLSGLSACPDLSEWTDTLDCPELTRCLDEDDFMVSPDRTGLSASTVEPGRQSSSDCTDLPDRLDFSRCPVPPDCLTDFSVDTKNPVTVSSELSPLDRTGQRGSGMSFTEENPENTDITEPDEGFKEPLESWMSGLSDIRMTLNSSANRLFGRVTCPLPDRGSRYRICRRYGVLTHVLRILSLRLL